MRTSGRFESHDYTIPFSGVNDEAHLVFFSDIHKGSPHFCADAWRDFTSWGKKQKRAYYIGNGDYGEWFRAHTRADLLRAMSKDEREQQDEVMSSRINDFANDIMFMKDTLIGLGEGNHGWEFCNGKTDAEWLADFMGTKFLGVCSVIRIVCTMGNKRVPILVYMHHGKPGSAQTAGGPYNALERMMKHVEGVTIYAMGDDHNCGILQAKPKMNFYTDVKSKRLLPRSKPQFYVRTGGYTTHYDPGTHSYVVDQALGPTSLGSPAIKIRLRYVTLDGGGEGLRAQFQAIPNLVWQ